MSPEHPGKFEDAFPTVGGKIPYPSAASLPEGTMVGRYRILRLIGEGGMGAVYEAEQDQPRRTVALKVIKPGLANPEIVRRFKRESQALGRLQHPGIAQIYEAGTADTGLGPQPYFAMEFIPGLNLRDYVEKQRLDTRGRLEIIANVCDAVHHAHQRGLIHRDLKPGNILVDESGQPKILDFGVAHVIDSDAQATLYTNVGELVGTLAYMSPEQVSGDTLDLDTRSDVYALGVILYELLAERLPHTMASTPFETIRAIRETDPVPLAAVNRMYRGDVETIVGKSLEKDKSRRYASAAGMAADIRRYLNDEPITARPASTAYQLRKFARRHRALVGAMAAVFVVLIAGVVASTWQAVRASRAEAQAIQERNRAVSEKQRADTESAIARAVNDFLQVDLLAQASADTQASPGTKPDPDLKVRTALDRAAARISGRFDSQPLVEASIRQTIGTTYRDLGLYAEAQQHMERAVEIRRRILGDDHSDTLLAANNLAVVYQRQGKPALAEPILLQTLETQRRRLGDDHLDMVETLNNLALLYRAQGKNALAEPLLKRILDVQRRVRGEEHADTLGSMNNLGQLYQAQGQYAQAEPLFTKALDTSRRIHGEDHPNTLIYMNNLAILYARQAKTPQAESLFERVLEIRERVLGEAHPFTLTSMNNLAAMRRNLGKYAQAEPLQTKALQVQRRVLGDDHPDTLLSLHNLAWLYRSQGKFAQAESAQKDVWGIRQRVLGERHPDTLTSMHGLALVLIAKGQYPEAEPVVKRVLEARRQVLGAEHPDTLISIRSLGDVYRGQGRFNEAQAILDTSLAAQRQVLGSDHASTTTTLAALGSVYLRQKKFKEAARPLREALGNFEKRQSDEWERYHTQSMLGGSLAGEEKYEEAEPLLISGFDGLRRRLPMMPAENRPLLAEAGQRLIELYEQWGKREEASEWRSKLQALREAGSGR